MVLRPAITAQIKELLKEHPQGLSITDIVDVVNINRNTAGRYLESLLVSGQVEMRHFGMAKIYTLSHRVPVSAVLSISSELILQLDRSLRVIYANGPFLSFIDTTAQDLFGKNIEYSPLVVVFDDVFGPFVDNIKQGIAGEEWNGELALNQRGIFFSCHIAPTVFDDGHKGVSVILEDITWRKENEARIQESEARYRLLAESSNDLIFMIGRDDRVEYVNRCAASLIGKSPADIIGQPRSTLFPDDQARHQRAQLQKVITSGTPCRSEGAIVVNGEVRWFDHFLAPVPDGNGQIRSVFGVSRDITARKSAEDALIQSEERFRRIFEDGPLGMTLVDTNFRFVVVNRKFCQMLGYTTEELKEQTFMSITHPDHVSRDVVGVHKIYAGEIDVYRTEKRYMTRGGSVLWASVTITPIRGADNRIHATIALIEDISERRNIEEKLRESELEYRLLAEYSLDIINRQAPDTTLLYVSPSVTAILGYNPEEFLGRKVMDLVHPDDLDIVHDFMIRISRGETNRDTLILRIQHKDGSYVWFESVIHAIRDPATGNVREFYNVSRDITARKQAERERHEIKEI
jgi:PAS domain S-box-containing protein